MRVRLSGSEDRSPLVLEGEPSIGIAPALVLENVRLVLSLHDGDTTALVSLGWSDLKLILVKVAEAGVSLAEMAGLFLGAKKANPILWIGGFRYRSRKRGGPCLTPCFGWEGTS